MSTEYDLDVWAPLTRYSGFAKRTLRLWPQTCQCLLDDARLNSAGVIQPVIHSTATAAEFEQHIRDYRQTECLRIAWRDVTGQADLVETMSDLSLLAEYSLQRALDFHWNLLAQQFGQPQAGGRFCIIAMGKLGGRELNFSSDLDVLFIYTGEGKTSGPRRIEYSDFFSRVARALVHSLEAVTEHGQAYRIDTRLRPYGNTGKLVWNTVAMEQYYLLEGRDWERYALLKARAVAGDIALGNQLLGELRPFIYRRYLDYGLFAGVRQLRNDIARAAAKKRHQDNLKIGPGGIREIEFLVQSLQLLRGGQQADLHQPNLLLALAALQQHDLLESEVGQSLHTAYTLLRQLENRLQMLDDLQEHAIPQDPQRLQDWAKLAGYADSAALLAELNPIRQQVGMHFHAWFGEQDDGSTAAAPGLESHADIDAWLALLAQSLGTSDQHLEGLFKASLTRLLKQPLNQTSRQRLQRLLPELLRIVGPLKAPEKPLLHGMALLEKIATRGNYLALLLEHPQALQRLLDYGARSDWIAQQLQQQPALLDDLIDPVSLNSLPDSRQDYMATALSLVQQSETNIEHALALLQQWRLSCTLRVAANELFQRLDTSTAQINLSHLAEACLHAVHQLSMSMTRGSVPLSIIAYGTLGAGEMHYSSDLDLVFLYADDIEQGERQVTRQAQKLIHLLTSIGPGSQLYDIDTRLRPNGQNGTLVSHIDAFENYQLKQAWIWEWQALSRARCVFGPPAIQQRFADIRQRLLQPARDSGLLREEILTMYNRIQAQYRLDALSNIRLQLQFLLQYWLLNNELSDELVPTSIADQAAYLVKNVPALKKDASQLALSYLNLQTLQHQEQLEQAVINLSPEGNNSQSLWEKYLML